jgi:hypothetical protein
VICYRCQCETENGIDGHAPDCPVPELIALGLGVPLDELRPAMRTLAALPPPSFTCPRCGATSYNPNDVLEGYCGACHDWTGGDS